MNRILRLALSTAVVLGLAAAPASAADGLTIVAVDTSRLPTVSVEISAPPGLAARSPSAEDFAVIVDGDRQEIDVYAGVVEPLEVVLLMDTSGSMEGAAIEAARDAAARFVAAMPPNATITVITFGGSAAVAAAPGDDATAALASLAASGETALYDAVALGAAAFSEDGTRRLMIVLSDGGDTTSATTLQEAVVTVSSGRIEVQAIALATDESDHAALDAIAPGAVTTIEQVAGLAGLYADIAARLTGTYRLEFVTTATGPTEIQVVVNTGTGVATASAVVDLPVPGAAARPAPPGQTAPAPILDPSVLAIRVEPTPLEAVWTLPVGIVLAFVGTVTTLWLTMRRREAAPDPIPVAEVERVSRLRRLAGAIGSAGDRYADRKPAGSMDMALDRAGVALRPGEFVVVSGTAIIVLTLAGLTLAGPGGAIVLGALAAATPRTILNVLTERRRRRFADQLEGTLQIIAGSLRAGYGLTQAISTVAAESPEPTASEFNRVVVENRLGRSIEDSLGGMVRRMEDEDLGWVVEAIEIQHEVGGDLAEVLDTVMTTIRDRNQIKRQVHALSAEGRISAYILISLPFVIAGFIAAISPDYLADLTGTGLGRIMLGIAAVMMVAGAAWIRRIIRIDF